MVQSAWVIVNQARLCPAAAVRRWRRLPAKKKCLYVCDVCRSAGLGMVVFFLGRFFAAPATKKRRLDFVDFVNAAFKC